MRTYTKKSHLDKAMTYAINNEKYLRYYIEDGRVEISNNSAERCCRALSLAEKFSVFKQHQWSQSKWSSI
ncbi:MAG: IS66 family transposase [Faecalibacillus faecis]